MNQTKWKNGRKRWLINHIRDQHYFCFLPVNNNNNNISMKYAFLVSLSLHSFVGRFELDLIYSNCDSFFVMIMITTATTTRITTPAHKSTITHTHTHLLCWIHLLHWINDHFSINLNHHHHFWWLFFFIFVSVFIFRCRCRVYRFFCFDFRFLFDFIIWYQTMIFWFKNQDKRKKDEWIVCVWMNPINVAARINE